MKIFSEMFFDFSSCAYNILLYGKPKSKEDCRKVDYKNRKAFTLAEILITLTVLGVVSSVILPNTIVNHTRQIRLTGLKVAYSTLLDLTENSRLELGNGKIPASGNSKDNFNKYLRPYLAIQKDCGTGLQTGKNRCFASPNGGWYDYSNAAIDGNSANQAGYFYKVVLKNGMSLAYLYNTSYYGMPNVFVVDVDGPYKGYSKLGQDTFMFSWASQGNLVSSASGRTPASYRKSNFPVAELVPGAGGGASWWTSFYYEKTAINHAKTYCKATTPAWGGGVGMGVPLGSGCSAYIILSKFKYPKDYNWAQVESMPNGFQPVQR